MSKFEIGQEIVIRDHRGRPSFDRVAKITPTGIIKTANGRVFNPDLRERGHTDTWVAAATIDANANPQEVRRKRDMARERNALIARIQNAVGDTTATIDDIKAAMALLGIS